MLLCTEVDSPFSRFQEIHPLCWFQGCHLFIASVELGREWGVSKLNHHRPNCFYLHAVVFLDYIIFSLFPTFGFQSSEMFVFNSLPVFSQLLLCWIRFIEVLPLPFQESSPIYKIFCSLAWIICSYKIFMAKRIENMCQHKNIFMLFIAV